MGYKFTIKPKNTSDPRFDDVRFQNAIVTKIVDSLHQWEPVSRFPKTKETTISYDTNGLLSITFSLDYITFNIDNDDDWPAKEIMKMISANGLSTIIYLSLSEHIRGGTPLVCFGDYHTIKYGYPIKYFPELLESANVEESNADSVKQSPKLSK